MGTRAKNTCPYSNLSVNATSYPLGNMRYRGLMSGDVSYSIYCYAVDDPMASTEYTFNKNVGKTVSGWVSFILTIYFHSGAAAAATVSVAKQVFALLFELGIVSPIIGGIATILISKTVECTYSMQEIHGSCDSHDNYGHVVIEGGIYARTTTESTSRLLTEGYTVNLWGDAALGRWMMWNMFGIDERPTSWTNL